MPRLTFVTRNKATKPALGDDAKMNRQGEGEG